MVRVTRTGEEEGKLEDFATFQYGHFPQLPAIFTRADFDEAVRGDRASVEAFIRKHAPPSGSGRCRGGGVHLAYTNLALNPGSGIPPTELSCMHKALIVVWQMMSNPFVPGILDVCVLGVC